MPVSLVIPYILTRWLEIICINNYYYSLYYSRYLETNLQTTMHSVIKTNGYFAHSENVLLAMLCDDRDNVRIEGATQILSARDRNQGKCTFFFILLNSLSVFNFIKK